MASKAHKPADSGVPVGNGARSCSLQEVSLNAFKHTPSSGKTCRSELARERLKDAAGHLVLRVIVHDLREQARSYRGCAGLLARFDPRLTTCRPPAMRGVSVRPNNSCKRTVRIGACSLDDRHKKTAFGGGFFEHVTFTGDGFSRVAEVESCTLSSTMWSNLREVVAQVST